MTGSVPPFILTPAHVMDLRVRMASVGFISDGTNESHIGFPFVTFGIASSEFYLHAGGFTVAISADNDLMCCLLRNERIEAGFIRRILDPATDAHTTILDPDERAALARQARAYAATQRLQQADSDAARRTLTSGMDPAKLSLSDLLIANPLRTAPVAASSPKPPSSLDLSLD